MCGDFLQEPSFASYRNNEIERRESGNKGMLCICFYRRRQIELQALDSLLLHHPSGVSHAVILAEYIYLADYGVVVNDV
jgi:hypothetical protein